MGRGFLRPVDAEMVVGEAPREEPLTMFVIATDYSRMDVMEKVLRRVAEPDPVQAVFRPRRVLLRRLRGEWVPREEDMFHNYVFVEIERARQDDLFFRLKDVTRWSNAYAALLNDQQGMPPGLKGQMNFRFLTAEETDFIRKLCNQDHRVELSRVQVDQEHPFRPGERVRVLSGPMKALEASITRVDLHRRRAYIATPFFGGGADMMVSFDLIGPAEETKENVDLN